MTNKTAADILASILYKSIVVRYRPVSYPDGPITARYRFITRAVIGQHSLPAGYILYCNIFIIKPYNIGHTDLDVFVCKSFCHIDIIIQV